MSCLFLATGGESCVNIVVMHKSKQHTKIFCLIIFQSLLARLQLDKDLYFYCSCVVQEYEGLFRRFTI